MIDKKVHTIFANKKRSRFSDNEFFIIFVSAGHSFGLQAAYFAGFSPEYMDFC